MKNNKATNECLKVRCLRTKDKAYDPIRLPCSGIGAVIYKKGGSQVIVPDNKFEVDGIKYEFSLPRLDQRVLSLADGPGEHMSEVELYDLIYKSICEVVLFPEPEFAHVISTYIFATYNWDTHPYLNYIGFTGFAGTGKSNGMMAAGCLSYNPYFGSGLDTEASILRSIDKIGGTLVLDECQTSTSNSSSWWHKLLALGFGLPGVIHKIKQNPKTGEFETETFDIRGPKILSGRYFSGDEAIISRIFETRMKNVTRNQLSNLKTIHDKEWLAAARRIRNAGLLYRQKRAVGDMLVPDVFLCGNQEFDIDLTPRDKQVFDWLMRECPNLEGKYELIRGIEKHLRGTLQIREQQFEPQVLRIAFELRRNLTRRIYHKEVALQISGFMGSSVSPKKIGTILRANEIETGRDGDGYYVLATADVIRKRLIAMGLPDPEGSSGSPTSPRVF
jgi:hypothetical protein